jgi:hypothetical protein
MIVTHFTIEEFCASSTALRLKIDNGLPEALEPQAWATLEMLERIRSHLSAKAGKDVSVSISSGYRCPALNKLTSRPRPSVHPCKWLASFRVMSMRWGSGN